MSILKLKDSQGNWISVPTLKGDKGNGIQSAVLNNDYTLTLTFTDGTTYTTPSIRGEKGEQGEPATDMDIHICSASEYDSETRIPTIANPNDKTFYLVPTEDGTSPDLFTEWVYVNNAWEMFGSASVDLTDYIKNTDYATGAKAGVIKLNPNYGINVTEDGILYINTAESKNTKMGTNNARPITPIIQHESTFYGLAKVAGHDEKDSELPVGQYTEEAKSSIQDMLDVPSTSELKEVNDSKADVIVESASGDIVSFDDGANDMPLKSLVVDINPVQDLNGYDSPWVGGGGKNKCAPFEEATSDIQYRAIYVGDGTFTASSTSPWDASNATVFFLAGNVSSGASSGGNGIRPTVPITQTAVDGYVTIAWRQVGDVNPTNYQTQIEEGSTATNWTPYENICPINGWTGVNLWQSGKNLLDVSQFLPLSRTTIDSVDATTGKIAFTSTASYYGVRIRIPIQKFAGQKLALSAIYPTTPKRLEVRIFDASETLILSINLTDSGVFSVPSTAVTLQITLSNSTVTSTQIVYDNLCLVVADTVSQFAPYQGRTINVNWETEGTVYEGKLDVLSGVLTILNKHVTITDADSFGNYGETGYTFKPNDMKSGMAQNGLCNLAPTVSRVSSYGVIFGSNNSIIYFAQAKSVWGVTTVADAKRWAIDHGLELVYPLAEPQTYQLTPHIIKSLLGHNTIYANTGNTSVEYCADTEMYIEKVKPVVNVDDVQINGTSVVNNGTANIPMATINNFGVMQLGSGLINNSSGVTMVNFASQAGVKTGSSTNTSISPIRQHESVFYGLTKAAGVDMASSSNAVGNYTEEAKSSIQNMLGITDKYSPKEWVAESETELVTNAHSVGDLFYIGETLYKVIADLNAGDAINVGVNVEEVNANDILDDYATKEDVQDNVSIVEKSVSGAVASFDDGMDDMPLKSLTVDINPVQKLNGYDSPWVAGGGKNKFDQDTVYGEYKQSDGSFLMTGGNGVNTRFYIPQELVGKELTFSAYLKIPSGSALTNARVAVNVGETASNGTFANTSEYTRSVKTFTPVSTDDCVYITYGSNGTQYLQAKDIQLEIGSTATDYAPYENICPINGWTQVGMEQSVVNVWDEEWELGSYSTTNGTPTTYTDRIRGKNRISVVPNTKYFFKTSNGITAGNIYFYNANDEFVLARTTRGNDVTVSPDNSRYMRISMGAPYGATYNHDISINYPSTDHDYHPYTGRSITIDLGQTVYGAKLYPLEGKALINMAMVDLGTLGYSKSSLVQNGFVATSGMPDDFPLAPSTTAVPNWICSKYGNIVSNSTIELASVDYALAWRVSAQNKGIIVKDSNYTELYTNNDMASFKAAMSGVQLVYELAEPIEIQLTPHEVNSLLGINNIWADTGNTSVEYFSQVDKDLIDYIETSLKPYAKEEKLNDYVDDVQVNGNSIVENNVANVPIATQNVIGALYTASEADGKVGTHTYRAIVPKVQHSSVFYGLAKAAGDITQSSSTNAIGTYTEEAKTAIKQMLGVHDTIDSFVEEVTGTDVTITGQPSYRYNCGELYSLTVTPPSSGTIDIRFTSGSTPTVLTLPQTVKMPEWWVEVEANTIYEMCITDGIYCGVMTWAI